MEQNTQGPTILVYYFLWNVSFFSRKRKTLSENYFGCSDYKVWFFTLLKLHLKCKPIFTDQVLPDINLNEIYILSLSWGDRWQWNVLTLLINTLLIYIVDSEKKKKTTTKWNINRYLFWRHKCTYAVIKKLMTASVFTTLTSPWCIHCVNSVYLLRKH